MMAVPEGASESIWNVQLAMFPWGTPAGHRAAMRTTLHDSPVLQSASVEQVAPSLLHRRAQLLKHTFKAGLNVQSLASSLSDARVRSVEILMALPVTDIPNATLPPATPLPLPRAMTTAGVGGTVSVGVSVGVGVWLGVSDDMGVSHGGSGSPPPRQASTQQPAAATSPIETEPLLLRSHRQGPTQPLVNSLQQAEHGAAVGVNVWVGVAVGATPSIATDPESHRTYGGSRSSVSASE
jgi:hypothetical protein